MIRKTRLAAGPTGPESTFLTRRNQKVKSASVIMKACLAVLEEGEHRPSIAKVLEAGSGFSASTLHRKLYKPILHAAQNRYDARAAGSWSDGDPDWLTAMEDVLTKGYWVVPLRPAEEADPYEDDRNGHTAIDELSPAEDPGTAQELSPLEIENVALRNRITTLEAEVQRRDNQLYHALQTCQSFSRTSRRLRGVIASLNGEIATLQTEPWEPREQGTWRDEPEDDEEWPENQ